MEKTYSQELAELKSQRKLLYKTFEEKESGDKYQLIMFTLEYGTSNLLGTVVLCSHTAYKKSIPMRAFKAMFTPLDEKETAGVATA